MALVVSEYDHDPQLTFSGWCAPRPGGGRPEIQEARALGITGVSIFIIGNLVVGAQPS